VISSSPTDLQPVMDVVAASAARFCGATDASIWRLEGESLRIVAAQGPQPTATPIGGTIAVTPRSVNGRVVLDRQTIHVEDILATDTDFPETLERAQRAHVPTRTLLATPLQREDVPIGVITLRRREIWRPRGRTSRALRHRGQHEEGYRPADWRKVVSTASTPVAAVWRRECRISVTTIAVSCGAAGRLMSPHPAATVRAWMRAFEGLPRAQRPCQQRDRVLDSLSGPT
jgi:hypothetical protein